VRFPLDAPGLSIASLPTDVEDGEQPAVSADGRWLGFLRRERGRASLWVVDRRGGPARRIAGAEPDVLDFGFFPDGRIALAAFAGGRARLFVTEPAAGQAAEMNLGDRGVRYPAVSPDGRWLAYAREEGASWQLWVAPLPAGEPRRLTSADCNAVTPAWYPDSEKLVYATDCGRGLGDTALGWARRPTGSGPEAP
jgi:Tol biopolymer transport system component